MRISRNGLTKLGSLATKSGPLLYALLTPERIKQSGGYPISNLRNLLDGLDAYSKGFMVHGLDLSAEQVELSLVEVRRRLNSKNIGYDSV
jgi:hypothetical protein